MTAPPGAARTLRSPQKLVPPNRGKKATDRDVLTQCDRCRMVDTAEMTGSGRSTRLTFATAAGVITDPHRERLAAARSAWAEAENDALVSGIRSTADRLRGEFRRVEAQRSAGPDFVHRGCGGRFRLFDTRRTAP